MVYLIGFMIAAYTLTKIVQAPFMVPGDGGTGHRGRLAVVALASVVGGLGVLFFTAELWSHAKQQAVAEAERDRRLQDFAR